MVTIKDIARESGYSVSTVSRVLNNRNDVSPDARKKIEEVVAKFNFVPNNNAKHLKQNNSKAIGVLVKGISNMLFASVVEEIQRMIEKTEYTLVVSYLDEDADEVEQAILLCRKRKPLGLLFLGGNPEYFHREFSGVDVPCVLVTNRANEMHFENLSSVATDDIAAARCAVDQLFVAGHRRIGILGGDYKDGLIREYTNDDLKDGRVEDSKLMWALGNYSRFIRPGAVRLSVSAFDQAGNLIPGGDTDQKGLMCSAYQNADGSYAVVLINYAQEDKEFSINKINGKKTRWQVYRTSDVEGEDLLPVEKVKSGRTVRIPARSIITLLNQSL